MNKKFTEGLEVRDLRDILENMTDKNENGEYLEVYIQTGKGLSSLANSVSTLNDGSIVIETDAFDE